MSLFEKQDKMAEEILTEHRGKVLAIVKATRAGATTSLLKRACELGQKTVIVAPYIEIFDTTVEDVEKLISGAKPRIARIPAYDEICERIKAKIDVHPELKSLPFHFKPSCTSCELNGPSKCGLPKILNSEWDILGLTYAKLRALCLSGSETASDFLGKIKQVDNLILDEFVTGIITASPSIEIEEPHAYLEREFGYFDRMLKRFGKNTPEIMFWGGVANFAIAAEAMGDKLDDRNYRVYENPVITDWGTFFQENFSKCWNLVEHLAVEGKDTKILQQLVQIITSDRIFIFKKEGKVSIKPLWELDDIARGSRYLTRFVRDFFSKGKIVALVDACLPDLNLKENLQIDLLERFDWGDPLKTNQSQLVICDTHKIGETNFFKSRKLQEELKKSINSISEYHGANTVLVATQNKDMWAVLEIWRKSKQIPQNLMTTYYRSDISRGITPDPMRRVLILIGAPYLPKEAYLPETYMTIGQTKDLQTAFKKSDMKSAFVNIIGRVKDPEGRELSIVYALGIKMDEVEALVKQRDVSFPYIARFAVQGVDILDFMNVAKLFLEISRERWVTPRDDLTILARAIRKCKESKKVQCGEIVPDKTKKVQQTVESYSDVLKQYGVAVVSTSRGKYLTCVES